MDEHHSQSRNLADPLVLDVARRLAETVALVVPSLVLVAATIFLARRLSGALVRPLPPSLLVSVVATAALAVWLWSICQNSRRAERSSSRGRLVAVALAVALMTLGACLSLPGTRPLALAIAWLLLIGSLWPLFAVPLAARPGWEGWSWRTKIGRTRDGESTPTSSMFSAKRTDQQYPIANRGPACEDRRAGQPARVAGNITDADDVSDGTDTGNSDSQCVTQQLTRLWDAEQGESIYGTMRANFAPNQRDAVLHVAFCPPFARVPRLDVQQQDGSEAQLKVGQLFAYGARIDVRLRKAPPAATNVVVELTVRESPAEDH